MTTGEKLYLALVIFAGLAYGGTLGLQTWRSPRATTRDPENPEIRESRDSSKL
ncbi:MAG: hypothetical protein U1E46_14865 [Hyphomicrobiales bacterium]